MKKRIFTLVLAVCLVSSAFLISVYGSTFFDWSYHDVYANLKIQRRYIQLNEINGIGIIVLESGNYNSAEAGLAYENMLNAEYDAAYLNATRLSGATAKYNCHSYAFVRENLSNPVYWLNSPASYYENSALYYEVFTPRAGDVICYFYDNGTPNNMSDDRKVHSGIVVETTTQSSNGLCGNSNTVIVDSKWKFAGLYRHNGYECPYTNYTPYAALTTPEVERANYVRYFRMSNHTHVFNIRQTNSFTFHEKYCSCGRIILEEHNWVESPIFPRATVSPTYIPQSECSKCGMIALNP